MSTIDQTTEPPSTNPASRSVHDLLGPDLALGAPLEQHLGWLDAVKHDASRYFSLWNAAARMTGSAPYASHEEDGVRVLMVGWCADDLHAERKRWGDALVEHLHASGHREYVLDRLEATGRVADHNSWHPSALTSALRHFLLTEGRVMLSPAGELIEGPTIPKDWGKVSAERDHELIRATQAYYRARSRMNGARYFKRAVRMLATRENGWLVLRASTARQAVAA